MTDQLPDESTNKKKLIFAANSFISYGICNSIIIDTYKKDYYHIPNIVANYILDITGRNYNHEDYSKFSEAMMNEVTDFFLSKQILIAVSDHIPDEAFPKLNTVAREPFVITNAVVEFNAATNIQLYQEWMQGMYINSVQFIYFTELKSIHEFCILVRQLDSGFYKTFQLAATFAEPVEVDIFIKTCNQFPRLENVQIFGCQEAYIHRVINRCIVFSEQPAFDSKYCGVVNHKYFNPTFQHYAESQHHNTCLNRKIAIDTEGNIKNCPSMVKSYGNIRDTKLTDVVNNPDFQRVWHIKKDEITKCRDCEFRHICTDCRAYIENPEDQYSAPLKCGYNPYTCEWEEWSTNPLKEKAIEFYGMEELVKKK